MSSPAFLFEQLTLGEKARVVRKFRQQELADRAGVSQAQISSLERGEYVPLSIKRKILRALDLEAEL